VGLGGRPRTQANETANETGAEAGGMTPASVAREIFLDHDARRASTPEQVAPRRVGGRRLAKPDGITRSDREVRGERAPTRRSARRAGAAFVRRLLRRSGGSVSRRG